MLVAVSTYRCVVHGAIAPETRARVVTGLTELESKRFGTDAADVDVTFVEVAEGTWFTAGKPSRASFVQGTVPPGTSQETRAAHMADVCEMFSTVTGSSYDDVVVVAANRSS